MLPRTWFLFVLIASTLLSGCADERVDCTRLIAAADGTNPAHTRIEIQTGEGSFKVELFDDASPVTVQNFKDYVRDGYYDHLVLHRVRKDWVIQGGKFSNVTGNESAPTGAPIELEAFDSGCKNVRYTLAMARARTDPNSAKAEFFVNLKEMTLFDATEAETGYAVFGIVYEGRDVIDRIEQVPVHAARPGQDPMCQEEPDGVPSCPDRPIEMTLVRTI